MLFIWAKPRASRSRVVGLREGRIEVQLAAPPVDGAANSALVQFLSKALSLSKSRIRLEKGETARSKQLRISGVSASEVEVRLGLSNLGEG